MDSGKHCVNVGGHGGYQSRRVDLDRVHHSAGHRFGRKGCVIASFRSHGSLDPERSPALAQA